MIKLQTGNLLDANAEAIVNTVNCEGFMGKGIALQFKRAYPENNKAYVQACKKGQVRPGLMLVFTTGSMINPRYIINFPTKRKWRENSRIEDIEAGLEALISEVERLNISSIAVPPLGCGLGGLQWSDVRPRIERAFDRLPHVNVQLFEPIATPIAKDMPVGTSKPSLTPARALIVRLMDQYSELDHRLTLLEIQKLAYFIQTAGQPMKLNYVAHHYGPYAHNLNFLLETLEGHYITGYGDNQRPDVEIELKSNASPEAEQFLRSDRNAADQLMRVASLIEGFETPYGMELLASVHWVASRNQVSTSQDAIKAIQSWSERKRRIFHPKHVVTAWNRLEEQGWIATTSP